MSSPYPRDDFDAVAPPRDGRRGAHRAAPGRPAGLVATLVIAAVVAVAGGTAWVALSPSSGSTASAASTPDSGAGTDAGADAAAVAAGDDAAPDDAAAGSDASPSSQPEGQDTDQAVDQSVPVTVLNGTGTKGLAATTATTLKDAGWTVSSTGNATSAQRSAHQGTVVLYPSADLEATATALSLALNGSAVIDDGAAAGNLTVLLLP